MQRLRGTVNPLLLLAVGSLVLVVGLIWYLMASSSPLGGGSGDARELTLFCAAGMRVPVEQIVAEYEEKYGFQVNMSTHGSNTLYSQIKIAPSSADLYIAGDSSYTQLGVEEGLIAETIPIAHMVPVIVVPEGNPRGIESIEDLFDPEIRVGLGNPDQAAIGKKTRKALKKSGHWKKLKAHVEENGVYQPTEPELIAPIKAGQLDAAIIWDATARRVEGVSYVAVPQLKPARALVEIGVVKRTDKPTAALRLARYLTARDVGLETFKAEGFDVVRGDKWAETPEITFFYGAVNREALSPVIRDFAEREGVVINEKPGGCGMLTADMLAMVEADQSGGFPDVYMACDVFYLQNVQHLFKEGVNVSSTDLVLVTQAGNPKNITGLDDLKREGVRVVVGQPEQCTIGALTNILLEAEGWDVQAWKSSENMVAQKPSSAMLVPDILAGSADVTIAYRTDTRAQADELHVIDIDSSAAQAIQPFSVALNTDHPHLSSRFFAAIQEHREAFESAGFNWRLGDGPKSNPFGVADTE